MLDILFFHVSLIIGFQGGAMNTQSIGPMAASGKIKIDIHNIPRAQGAQQIRNISIIKK